MGYDIKWGVCERVWVSRCHWLKMASNVAGEQLEKNEQIPSFLALRPQGPAAAMPLADAGGIIQPQVTISIIAAAVPSARVPPVRPSGPAPRYHGGGRAAPAGASVTGLKLKIPSFLPLQPQGPAPGGHAAGSGDIARYHLHRRYCCLFLRDSCHQDHSVAYLAKKRVSKSEDPYPAPSFADGGHFSRRGLPAGLQSSSKAVLRISFWVGILHPSGCSWYAPASRVMT